MKDHGPVMACPVIYIYEMFIMNATAVVVC